MSNTTLQALTHCYRRSAAGKGKATGECFLIDYEKFLRDAGLSDGDERELAEMALRQAESQSGGLLSIDRQPKTNDPERIRLRIEQGEDWLFQQIQEPSPQSERQKLANFFHQTARALSIHDKGTDPLEQEGKHDRKHDRGTDLMGLDGGTDPMDQLLGKVKKDDGSVGDRGTDPLTTRGSKDQDRVAHPDLDRGTESLRGPWDRWRVVWGEYFEELSLWAMSGQSVQPFKRDDLGYNRELVDVLQAVMCWEEVTLIRYASTVICGDSKRLQALEGALLQIIKKITGETTLEFFGILKKPRTVTFHGSLELTFQDGSIDFSPLPGPMALSESNLDHALSVSSKATVCLSVENEDVFYELAKGNPGVLLILTSYPGAAVRKLYRLLPESLSYYHFGDTDPSGFDILRDLREKTKLPISPWMMDHQPGESAQPFSPHEHQLLSKLISEPILHDLHLTLSAMQRCNDKGRFEQENRPIRGVLESLRLFASEVEMMSDE